MFLKYGGGDLISEGSRKAGASVSGAAVATGKEAVTSVLRVAGALASGEAVALVV